MLNEQYSELNKKIIESKQEMDSLDGKTYE